MAVYLNNKSVFFGGNISKVSFSPNFSSYSTASITFISEDGEYDISEDDLSSEDPIRLKISNQDENFEMDIFPVSYSKSKSPSGRILSVSFVDSSLKFLDKHIVLLKGKHIPIDNNNYERVLKVGKNITTTSSDYSIGSINSNDDITENSTVLYKLSHLSDEIDRLGIPISREFVNFMRQKSELWRDYVGTLREVLSAWAGELGFFFFWDNFSDSETQRPIGILDFQKETKNLNTLVEKTVADLSSSCKITNCLESKSIIENHSDGAMLFSVFAGAGGGSDIITKTSYMEPLQISYGFIRDPSGVSNIETSVNDAAFMSGLKRLAKASFVGEEFYRGYVLTKLMASSWEANPIVLEDTDLNIEDYLGTSNDAVSSIYGSYIVPVAQDILTGRPLEAAGGTLFGQNMAGQIEDEWFKKSSPKILTCYATLNDSYSSPETPAETGVYDAIFRNVQADFSFKSIQAFYSNYGKWWYYPEMVTQRYFDSMSYKGNTTWEYGGLASVDSDLSAVYKLQNYIEGDDLYDTAEVMMHFNGEAPFWKKTTDFDTWKEAIFDNGDAGVIGYEKIPHIVNLIQNIASESTLESKSVSSSSLETLDKARVNCDELFRTKPTDLDYGIILHNGRSVDAQPLITRDTRFPFYDSNISYQVNKDDADSTYYFALAARTGLDEFLDKLPILEDIFLTSESGVYLRPHEGKRIKYSVSKDGGGSPDEEYVSSFKLPELKNPKISSVRINAGLSPSFEELYDIASGIPPNDLPSDNSGGGTDSQQDACDESSNGGGGGSITNLYLAQNGADLLVEAYSDTFEDPIIMHEFEFDGIPRIPSIAKGLESLSISLEDSITTTMSVGNSKRLKQSEELKARSLVTKNGIAGSSVRQIKPSILRLPIGMRNLIGV